MNVTYLHTWTATHFNRLMRAFQESVHREPPNPAGAPLDHVPSPPCCRRAADAEVDGAIESFSVGKAFAVGLFLGP